MAAVDRRWVFGLLLSAERHFVCGAIFNRQQQPSITFQAIIILLI